jgi:hypothetical protein
VHPHDHPGIIVSDAHTTTLVGGGHDAARHAAASDVRGVIISKVANCNSTSNSTGKPKSMTRSPYGYTTYSPLG